MKPDSTAHKLRFLDDLQRIALVFSIARNPIGWVDACALVPLAGDNVDGRIRVTVALLHLKREGLVDLHQRHGTFLYRRTEAGNRIGQRLLRDRRRSFLVHLKRSGESEGIDAT